jgi:hypothetical protein
MICRINKEKFKAFLNSLELREEDDEIDFDDEGMQSFTINVGNKEFSIKIVTFKIDDDGFIGANWSEKLNEIFKSKMGD